MEYYLNLVKINAFKLKTASSDKLKAFKFKIKAIKGILFLLRLVPNRFITITIKLFTPLLIKVLQYKYDILFKNYSVVFEKSEEHELKKYVQRGFQSHILNIILSAKYMFTKQSKIKFKNEIIGPGKSLLKKHIDKPIIFVVPHLDIHFLNAKIIAKKVDRPILIPLRGSMVQQNIEKLIYKELSIENLHFTRLGGAMPEVEELLKNKGVLIMPLDAVLPLKYKRTVNFFGYKFDVSTGPFWLAQKYNVPIYSGYGIFDDKKMKIDLYIDNEIEVRNEEQTLNEIIKRFERYITSNPGSWNHTDDFFREKY